MSKSQPNSSVLTTDHRRQPPPPSSRACLMRDRRGRPSPWLAIRARSGPHMLNPTATQGQGWTVFETASSPGRCFSHRPRLSLRERLARRRPWLAGAPPRPWECFRPHAPSWSSLAPTERLRPRPVWDARTPAVGGSLSSAIHRLLGPMRCRLGLGGRRAAAKTATWFEPVAACIC